MIFVSSDLHGFPLSDFKRLLAKANFSKNDFLFILGDVIDRGKHGAELLLWLTEQENVQLILGNHEALLLSCSFLFEDVTDQSLEKLNVRAFELYENWILNGGNDTISGLQAILKKDKDVFQGIIEYLQDAPLYEHVEIKGNHFILVHSGLGNFSPSKDLAAYTPEELLFERPEINTQYYNDAMVIFGHTPTDFYGEKYSGRMVCTPSWICIDTGAAAGNPPMLLRLDDTTPFYLND